MRNRAKAARAALIGAMVTFGLTACGRSERGMFASRDGGAATAKLNAYTRAHNTLLGEAGLQVAEENYLGPGPHALVSEKLGFGLVTLGQSLAQARDELKAARAIPGGSLADTDRAADALVTAIDKTTAKLSDVNAYYGGGTYKQDGLAKGRREDGPVATDLGEADAAMQHFNEVVEIALQRQTLADINRLKARGDLLDYDVKLGIQQARSAMELFKRPEDIANPARFKQADSLMTSLERTLVDLRLRIEKAKRDRKPSQPEINPNYDGAADALLSLTGAFRAFEARRSRITYDAVVEKFNTAVSDANYITL